jgi:hypothetical protein
MQNSGGERKLILYIPFIQQTSFRCSIESIFSSGTTILCFFNTKESGVYCFPFYPLEGLLRSVFTALAISVGGCIPFFSLY